jgi:RHS repeat-associated protein
MPTGLANLIGSTDARGTRAADGTTARALTTTRTVNSLNQLTATGTDSQYMSALAYDAAGAMTTDSLGRTLVYDAWGRLVQVCSGQTVVQNLTYDGTGRLIVRSDGTTPTDSYFTGTQDIEQRTGVTAQSNGTAGVLTFFSPVYVNAVLARDRDTDANGTLDQRVYFTSDANFNVTSVISAAGTALQHQVYDAYGNITFTAANADWTPLSPNADGYAVEHLYQGMLFNAEIGWYFAGQSNVGRWYSPAEMTWSRADSAGYIDGASLYAFVAANPINFTDPSGFTPLEQKLLETVDRNVTSRLAAVEAAIKSYDLAHVAVVLATTGRGALGITGEQTQRWNNYYEKMLRVFAAMRTKLSDGIGVTVECGSSPSAAGFTKSLWTPFGIVVPYGDIHFYSADLLGPILRGESTGNLEQTMFHELSHIAAATQDLYLSWAKTNLIEQAQLDAYYITLFYGGVPEIVTTSWIVDKMWPRLPPPPPTSAPAKP